MTKEERIYQQIASDNHALRWAARGTEDDSAQRMVGAMQSLLKHADTLCPGVGFATSVDLVDVGLIASNDSDDDAAFWHKTHDEMWSKWQKATERTEDSENALKRANEYISELQKKIKARRNGT